MATNAISAVEVNIHERKTQETATEHCVPLTLKQRFEKLLRTVFQGHEEFLGLTPD